jgi:hypothetical protein
MMSITMTNAEPIAEQELSPLMKSINELYKAVSGVETRISGHLEPKLKHLMMVPDAVKKDEANKSVSVQIDSAAKLEIDRLTSRVKVIESILENFADRLQ